MRKLPDGWRDTSVADLCTLLNGLAFKPEDWTVHGLPILRIQNLNGSAEFNRYDKPIPPAYVVEGGTLLFSWSGNRGTSFGPYRWNGPTAILNQHIFKVTPKPDVDPTWLLHALSIARQLAERAAHGGSGLVHVRRGDLLGYRIPSPLLPEQRQLAEILDTVDEAIRKTEEIIAKLKQVKRGLLHDLLTRGIDENGELRDPERHPEQFKDSPLGRIPTAWRFGCLEQWLAQPPRNGYSPKAVDEWTGRVMLGLGCLTLEGFAPVQIKNAPGNDTRLDASVLRDGDLLLSRANTRELVGLAGTYRDVGLPCTYPDLMMRLTPSLTTSPFLELVLRSSPVRRQFQAMAVGTSGSMVKISGAIVTKVSVAMPPEPEQFRILGTAASSRRLIEVEQKRASQLRLLKQGLMEDLLTGRVRVTKLLKNAAE